MTLPFAGNRYHVTIWLVGGLFAVFLAVGLVHVL